ncbi:MAG TPA: flavin prenyltransferase UbiX [Armatimonadota bacterium]|nr:flavin prenyltransferase UbiX [Armatimonadota bacterium]HOM81798.1 flavin prenyltransferase UbiX [Armatimonadota bacterium]HOQ27684.1 flavin prenyltransferase UbiX [Armatimonadota bacterium]HPO73328.1 flavin prenyltransferase UbiX [Armatimonadota bacterium]
MSVSGSELLVAITGASGSVYGLRLIERAAPLVRRISVVVSRAGARVIAHEMGTPFDLEQPSLRAFLGRDPDNVRFHHPDDLFAPCASGSSAPDAMVVVPCTMGTAARIAAGIAEDLIGRAADVVLKEHRQLILVPRETPLNLIHLRNLTTLAEAGALILPACPGFYHHPRSIEELVDFVVGRILDHLGLPNPQARWGEE